MKRFFITITCLLLLASCADKSKAFKPEQLLSEQEMVAVMTDVQIIEADMNRRKADGTRIDGMAESYYSQLFEHYAITDSIFSQNLRYYTERPEVLERIMDSVTQRLTKEQVK